MMLWDCDAMRYKEAGASADAARPVWARQCDGHADISSTHLVYTNQVQLHVAALPSLE